MKRLLRLRRIDCLQPERTRVSWEADLADLLAGLDQNPERHIPSLKQLASNCAPAGHPDTIRVQREVLREWVEAAPSCFASQEALARGCLQRALPSEASCNALLSLPMSLRTGVIRINTDGFGPEIVDFADRTLRLRCCQPNEAWRMCFTPLVAVAAALAELLWKARSSRLAVKRRNKPKVCNRSPRRSPRKGLV